MASNREQRSLDIAQSKADLRHLWQSLGMSQETIELALVAAEKEWPKPAAFKSKRRRVIHAPPIESLGKSTGTH
jgi:hypothetical protein